MGVRIKSEAYNQWLTSASCKRLLAMEAGWLREVLVDLRGQHLLYSGIDSTPRFLKRNRMRHAFVMGMPWAKDNHCDARMSDDLWPLADESVEAVILQHSLDMSVRPHQMVREASRVLQSSGYLVIVGWNPYSIFGASKAAMTLSAKLPWIANCVSSNRLEDWLTLLDFRVERVSHIAHLWPLRMITESASRRFDRVAAGHNWLPSNAYILVARKTVAGTTRLKQRRWSLRPDFVPTPAIARLPAIHNIQPTGNCFKQ
ncbi:methyltransferase domain-containing protein [Oceanobacter kriegii]|uniref:methyltransferase domain-containing protein n=1 Tax=Oceanobacter kriegii TaxID=64972 RepID=UPI0004282153|nr:methyltransferase domain-containing protein [Oceanobacter kriegii]